MPDLSGNILPAVEAFLALGSNLGDRSGNLRNAVAALRAHDGIEVVTTSPVYETRAHTLAPGEDQPDYLNAVVRLRTTLPLPDLLSAAQYIERAAGRDRNRESRWAARTLDLDILLYGTETCAGDRITVPHPRLGERLFVLRPLADLAPGRYVPEPFNATVLDLLARCPETDLPVRTDETLE